MKKRRPKIDPKRSLITSGMIVWPDRKKIVYRLRPDGWMEGRFKHRGKWHVCEMIHPKIVKFWNLKVN